MPNKINIRALVPGDIILVGYNDENGREIQRLTNSKFSHAMLYWYGSVIHASDIVITENPSRMLFDEDEAVCILRLKEEYWKYYRMEFLINYARSLVGTFYDRKALIAMRDGKQVEPKENRQMCARFVAQCYDYVCLDLVEDYMTCTPEDIFQSNLLTPVPDPLLEATQEDIEFAESYNVAMSQFVAIKSFLISLKRNYPQKDIVSLEQLELFLTEHPAEGDKVLDLLKQTAYFRLWELEKEHCQYLYDTEAFMDKWKGKARDMAFAVIKESKRIIREKRNEIHAYKGRIAEIGDIEYYRQMIDLRKHIIETAAKRIEVAEQVLAKFRVVKIKFPWLNE